MVIIFIVDGCIYVFISLYHFHEYVTTGRCFTCVISIFHLSWLHRRRFSSSSCCCCCCCCYISSSFRIICEKYIINRLN